MKKKEKFQEGDSIQVVTVFTNGIISFKRGILFRADFEDNNVDGYVFVYLVNSNFSKFVKGTIINEEILTTINRRMMSLVINRILRPCRIVLIEKIKINVRLVS